MWGLFRREASTGGKWPTWRAPYNSFESSARTLELAARAGQSLNSNLKGRLSGNLDVGLGSRLCGNAVIFAEDWNNFPLCWSEFFVIIATRGTLNEAFH